MSSPMMESFCCSYSSNISYVSPIHDPLMVRDWYNIVCIVSSTISIAGALFQVWPRYESEIAKARKEANPNAHELSIVHWLAVADLLAAFGILMRSVAWLTMPDTGSPSLAPSDGLLQGTMVFPDGDVFCAIVSAWIHFFYMSTYLWTFIYAFDVFLSFKQRKGSMLFYHFVVWGTCTALCIGGLVPLYYPSIRSCGHERWNLLPHYVTGLAPILFVMAVNPVLYLISSLSVKTLLTANLAKYTEQERRVVAAVREKFILVLAVFFICWTPNVINGALMWSALVKYHRKHVFMQKLYECWLAIWFMMAILNPLQAFLNVLVYSGWRSWRHLQCPCARKRATPVRILADSLLRDETSMLSASFGSAPAYGSSSTEVPNTLTL
ncbi:PREDICTED: G-protein coupled receptor 143-like [Priapulus caudatus]|uniref:G-protein coupled receptor 143-like n=1 Tax=Priapulus caudatus TaxID=37621 RepID=A0ABM1EVK0_PRICU|nr:PREDICTED: G-protein coupled receptor 143-like [Priapulus caudatus]